ncbi:inositol monophosphatase family protein [Nodosilinea sp. P-1105]|uniref:3'(2'),5'-bisphosphate nucleotidase CysQ family protein n=1 Tax=Nodosilinea sp. P-1105 TaxID=2546229 RepID=UPI00146C486E|nr:inositol monophosphatase family protein [Nodosilinea sp. P-1105]NMF85074.1 inositol monophosphatase family protein [Nodosilinea sp. P-1105]
MVSLSQSEISAINQLLVSAGNYALAQSRQSFQVFEKGIDDYVTTVDQALDQKLLSGFQQLFPEDGVITEENQATARQFRQDYRRLWFIDPIDGTDDFIGGRANYAVMVGLVVDGVPQVGWIYAPVHHQLVWGGPDWGLFQQHGGEEPQPLVPREPPLVDGQPWALVIGDKDERRFGQAIAARLPQVNFVSLGSFGLKVLAVITGQAGLYIYLNGRVKLWDTTGPLALAQAAGLICCDLAGNPIWFDEAAVDPDTLIHRQPIVVGWPHYVNRFRDIIREVATIGV